MKQLLRFLTLAVAVLIIAITPQALAQQQTSYQLTGLCHSFCLTQTPTQTLDIYLTSNDSSGVPYKIDVFTAPSYSYTETLAVAADGTFPGGSLTNIDVVTLVHNKGRIETKQVILTAQITFDAPPATAPAFSSPLQSNQTTTYTASQGYVSASNEAIFDFDGGGSANVYVNLPSLCRYGQPCNYQGREVVYELADGSSATLTNLNGTFDGVGTVTGTASGTDNSGRSVDVSFSFSFIVLPQHRGTSKLFIGGTFTVTASPTSSGPGMPAPIPPQPNCPTGGNPNCCDGHGCANGYGF